jgi:hypothetical protein
VAGQHFVGYSHLFLEVLHCVCRMLASGGTRRRYDQLRAYVTKNTGLPLPTTTGRAVFERLGLSDRHRVLLSALWLLADWPDRFVEACQRAGVTGSLVVGDQTSIPYWFDSSARRTLDASLYSPNEGEALEVAKYLKNHGQVVSRRSIAQHLGAKNIKAAQRISVAGTLCNDAGIS